jgi:hypothetical protein
VFVGGSVSYKIGQSIKHLNHEDEDQQLIRKGQAAVLAAATSRPSPLALRPGGNQSSPAQ